MTPSKHISLDYHAIIVPTWPEHIVDCPNESLYAEAGTELTTDDLFNTYFQGYEVLTVIRLPDFDPDNIDEVNAALDYYDDHTAEMLESSTYELAKVYH